MGRIVGSVLEAEAIIAKVDARLRDMRPFWDILERASGALDVAEREVWAQRFGMGIRHHESTIEDRAAGRGYYENPRGKLATRSSPFFYWTGSLLDAASHFTTTDEHTATIDPDANYRGPLEGVVPDPFSDIVGRVVPDDRIFDDRILGGRIERDLSAYLFKALES